MNKLVLVLSLLTAVFAGRSTFAEVDRLAPIPRLFSSSSGQLSVKVIPHDARESEVQLIYLTRGFDAVKEQVLWSHTLPYVPVQVLVNPGNEYAFVTIDEWTGEKENTLNVYAVDFSSSERDNVGNVVKEAKLKYSKKYSLTDLFSPTEIQALKASRYGTTYWTADAKISFPVKDMGFQDQFEIQLTSPAKQILIDLETGELAR